MQQARQAKDVKTVRCHAVAVIELNITNTKVVHIHVDLKRPLKVIAVVGTDRHGQRAILLEIGMSRGVPWGTTHGSKTPPRQRIMHYEPNPVVRNATFRLLGTIAEHRMNKWKTHTTFEKKIARKHKRKLPWWSSYEFYRGIRFAFSHDDADLIEFLRWHEVYHSTTLRKYLANRINWVLWILSKPRSTERMRKGGLTLQAERLLETFTRGRTLQDPYVLSEFLRMLRESAGEKTHTRLLDFLEREKAITRDIIEIVERSRPRLAAVPHLDIEVRLACKRQDGTVSYQIHRRPPKHASLPIDPCIDDSDDCPF
ncbi:MAG: hypothetical protein AAB367_01945 [Patescibacteria group bacterium]